MDDHVRPHRVVVVGGGFGGLYAARVFRRRPVTLTLIDSAGQHLFQPLLYQCATGVLSEGQIAVPLRRILKRHENVECLRATVTGVDPAGRLVAARRPDGSTLRIPYDHLIVSAGLGQSYFGHDEFARFAPGMKTIGDALTIRGKILDAFEMAESLSDPVQRRRWLTFALVGAGPTGVELAGQIRELATQTLRDEFRHIDPEDARVLLFEGGPAALASFGPKLSARAALALDKLGVELYLRSLVTRVDETGIEVKAADGTLTHYAAATVLWAAGVRAPGLAGALARATGAEQDRVGRIKVTPRCTIPGHPEIFVVGDLMALEGLPGVAEVAMQSGRYAGLCVRDVVEHRPRERKPFRYRDLGSAAYLSRGRAVFSFGRIRFSGFVGWVVWLFVHIAFLTGFRNRVGAVLSWAVTFSRGGRRERATLEPVPGPAGEGEEP
ncbi:MAG TPA: NAD(P)/FAD-dependent oxidoreductase [Amycolatopsis sp.]|nr:NAD(P)/FAD-dependent oxidoreductase [Amycolatopsis sp.]